ncbi:hypothetical protein KAFR_0G00530 [Kazachstania africana CBS 2517]|uniref:Cell wall mannoprotein PIR1-like C-terminal domain-containing protein n=1 Tax=Kazachstania africana (strain ATCC 22294 / BCRC 22015 / CBS 2517 / CECT 1963 / NBRC 1671 / NRRL Y-8276) TaxID=1071382 RepID=H2AXI6_KAZAF|nr:hypothetical protein KAFR_0G00530 [Kazachstania africana CBS 2517]CCF59086.1 hypothetical protein KAFR_0G00530 [Kazachstania africana CBS 2517]
MQFKSFAVASLATVASVVSATGYTVGDDWTTLKPNTTYACGYTNYTTAFGIAIQTIATSSSISSSAKATSTTSSTSTLKPSSSSSTASTCTTAATFTPNAVSCSASGTLELTLEDGILTDAKGRIGSIVANRQFQFDGPPPQAGAIYAAGWSITPEGNLAIGDNDVFYQCLSGTFYNLYDESIGAQCSPVHLEAVELTTC